MSFTTLMRGYLGQIALLDTYCGSRGLLVKGKSCAEKVLDLAINVVLDVEKVTSFCNLMHNLRNKPLFTEISL